MKTLLGLLSFVLLITCTISCAEKSPKKPVVKKPIKTTEVQTDSDVNIDLATFNAYRSTWRNGYVNRMDTDSLSYFDVQNADLEAMLGENGLDSTRIYLGMKGDTVHLLFVGMEGGAPNFGTIADYTNSCPPVCPN